jgi:hypothetical protein
MDEDLARLTAMLATFDQDYAAAITELRARTAEVVAEHGRGIHALAALVGDIVSSTAGLGNAAPFGLAAVIARLMIDETERRDGP